jgi:hypothetical protein
MDDKELKIQLNNLKKIRPDSQWKKDNRGVLFNQISGPQASVAQIKFNWFKAMGMALPKQLAKNISQPTMAVIFIVVFLLGGSILSLKAAQDTKPGDSFYIAKILSEKTQLVLTFNEKEKALLGIEFAGNRAKEINQVLAEPGDGGKDEKVGKLVDNFKKEIRIVKTRLEKINPRPQTQVAVEEKIATEENVDIDSEKTGEENTTMFSANLGKEENGLEIFEPESGDEQPLAGEEAELPEERENFDIAPSSTPEIIENASSTVSGDAQTILKQAEELLTQEDFDATLSKLDEADEAINQVDVGQVKGESEEATSTNSGIESDNPSEENSSNGNVLGVEEKAEDIQADDLIKDSASTTVD